MIDARLILYLYLLFNSPISYADKITAITAQTSGLDEGTYYERCVQLAQEIGSCPLVMPTLQRALLLTAPAARGDPRSCKGKYRHPLKAGVRREAR